MSISAAGYTFCFFFQNQPAPNHYSRQRYSMLQFLKLIWYALASFACLIRMPRVHVYFMGSALPKSHGLKKKGMCTMTRTKDGENEVFSTKIGG
jgi:hypothetical protein